MKKGVWMQSNLLLDLLGGGFSLLFVAFAIRTVFAVGLFFVAFLCGSSPTLVRIYWTFTSWHSTYRIENKPFKRFCLRWFPTFFGSLKLIKMKYGRYNNYILNFVRYTFSTLKDRNQKQSTYKDTIRLQHISTGQYAITITSKYKISTTNMNQLLWQKTKQRLYFGTCQS